MELPVLDVPVHVHLFHDAESFYRQYYTGQGFTGDELERLVEADFWSGFRGAVAFTGAKGIHGFAAYAGFDYVIGGYEKIAIHELTHVYQNRLGSQAYPDAPRGYSKYLDWLTEGMAELMAELVWSHASATTQWSDYPEDCGIPLNEILSHGAQYTTGLLAARLLASKVGARGLFDLHLKIYPNEPMHSAMERVLGVNIDDLSDDLKQYCADGRPYFDVEPIVDYPLSRLPLQPWVPSCKVLYPDDVASPESSSIIVALENICEYVMTFDLVTYDSVAIVDDDPGGLADLIEAHTNSRYDLSSRPLGLAISGTGFATFLTTGLSDASPSWLTREVSTQFSRLMFFNDSPFWLAEGMGELIPDLSEAYATGETYEYFRDSGIQALRSVERLDTLEQGDLADLHLTVAREAVELLLSTYGLQRTARYFAQDVESDWRVRFEMAYGIRPDQFYDLYDQHREARLMMSCNVVYPEDVVSAGSSSIIVVLENICDFVMTFDLVIYDSVAIVDDDPGGLADLIEAHTNSRYDLSSRPLGLAISGTGFATFLTSDLNDTTPSWLSREVSTNFTRLVLFGDAPLWFAMGMGEVIPDLSEAYATGETYGHSAASRIAALEFEPSVETLEWEFPPSDTHLSTAREAVELLLATYGLQKTAKYFAQDFIPVWRVRFESAYGITPDEFYALYEQHREAGLPDLEIDLTPFDPVSE